MARFDVYRRPETRGYLLDCQSDLLGDLDTRFTVPLFLFEDAPKPAGRLNPAFSIDGQRVVMMTQYASAIRKNLVGIRVDTLEHEQDVIMGALDMLLVGY
jgi:toxin CcdB